MKLYIYDEKHENIVGETELGNLTDSQIGVLRQVIDFLDEKGITTRYKRLVVARNAIVELHEGETEVSFEEQYV